MNQTSPKVFVKDRSKISKVLLAELNALKEPKNSSIKIIDKVIIVDNLVQKEG